MGLTVAQLFARVGVSGADSSVRTLKGVSGQVDATQRRMDGMGGASKRLTAGMAKVGAVAGGVLVAGMVGSAKAAMSWESAITGVAKTIEGDVSAIGKGIRDMALEIPIAATELAAIAEAGGALGVAKGDILGFTETVAKLGETTDLTTDAAATGLGHLKTTLNLTGVEFEQVGDILVNLGNKGASTESQILGMAENIAGAANTIGATKEQVLAWASAMANTGEEVEAGGSSIQRFWLETFSMVQKGGADLKLLAKTAGMTAGQFKRAYEKDAAGTLQKFMVSLGKLTKAEQLATLEGLGFTDIRIQRALLKLLGNTDNLADSINTANDAGGALGVESQKRFDTVASAVGTVKNAFFEMGVSIGTGMLPHIKRFADETVAFVKGNRDELAALGDDVGSFLGRIDMGEVLAMGRDLVSVMKDAAGFVLKILEAVNQLPGPIKAAGAGLLVLNKASGGAVSDIIGGAAGSVVKGAAGRVPGLGSLVAQPVRVVNWPIGLGAGGLPGAVAGKGGLVGALKGLIPLAIGAAVVEAAASVAGVTRDAPNRTVNDQGNIVRAVSDVGQKIGTLQAAEKQLAERAAGGDTFAAKQLAAVRDELTKLNLGSQTGHFSQISPVTREANQKDDIVNLAQLQKGTNALLIDQFRQMVGALKAAKGPDAVRAAVAATVALVVGKGRGNVAATRGVVADLKLKLAQTDDPRTRAALTAAIAKVERKIAGREFAAAQNRTLEGMLRDGKLSKDELSKIKGIEQSLRDRGLPAAANRIREKVEQAKRDQVAASRSAGQQTAFAIRDKRFSADVTIRPQTAYFNIDGSRVARAVMPYVRPGQAPRAS